MRLLVIFVLCVGSVRLIEIIGQGNDEVFAFVRSLISDNNRKSRSTNDVAVVKFNLNRKSKQNVEDMFDKVLKAIPKQNPVFYPTKFITGKRIPDLEFFIIVSDAGDDVSKVPRV